MRLCDTQINVNYNSYVDDIIMDFYINALSSATNYDRVSAYFNSKILSLYSIGIVELYKRNGKIRFIFSHEISEEDFILMQNGYENRDRIEANLLSQIRNDEKIDENDLKRLSNLAFLIEIGVVDIKIAFTRKGVFHDKFGLIYDSDDYIYFRGSNNETLNAVLYSYESFETSTTWQGERRESEKIKSAISTFDSLWNNEASNLVVLSIPDILKDEIIKFNSGILYLEKDIFQKNSIILDFKENNCLVLRNKTEDNYDLNTNWTFKNFVKKYINVFQNDLAVFNENITHITMNKIIGLVSDICIKNNYNFIVTDNLRLFISDRDLKIEKRRLLGINVKNEDVSVKAKFEEFKNIVDFELDRKLRNIQMWNAFHIVSMVKSANFSVPGSGKTSIVYGAFAYLNSDQIEKVNKIIMIGPKNSFLSWKDEFYENFKDKKKIRIIDIQDSSKYRNVQEKINELRFESENANLILINYELLNSLEDVLKEIVDHKTMLVFDEVHKVKAINGKRAKSALNICKKAKYRIALSGTPIPNSYQDLYNLLNILYTDEYDSFFKYTPAQLSKPTENLMGDINDKIYPFYCRITKNDLKIPLPNQDIILAEAMNRNEELLFEMLWKKYNGKMLTLYIRLMQAATNPQLLLNKINEDDINNIFISDEEETNDFEYLTSKVDNNAFNSEEISIIKNVDVTSKFKAGIDLIKKLVSQNKQVLIWGIFVDTLNKIKITLKDLNINCALIDGSVSQEERERIIGNFKNGDYQVLITNPHTMAESVSLHKSCHDAVYFEYSFNLTHMLQSRDRINRLGLSSEQYTQYYYLMLDNSDITCNSIDERIYNRLKEKEQIMLDSIEGNKLEPIVFNELDDIESILKTI